MPWLALLSLVAVNGCQLGLGFVCHEHVLRQIPFVVWGNNNGTLYFGYQSDDEQPPAITQMQVQNGKVSKATALISGHHNAHFIDRVGETRLFKERGVFWMSNEFASAQQVGFQVEFGDYLIHGPQIASSGELVFMSTEDLGPTGANRKGLFAGDPLTGKVRTLTLDPQVSLPRRSPNGEQMAYQQLTSSAIKIVPVKAGSSVTSVPASGKLVGWRDNRTLLVTGSQGKAPLYALDIASQNKTTLINETVTLAVPSPDGQRLALVVLNQEVINSSCQKTIDHIRLLSVAVNGTDTQVLVDDGDLTALTP